MRDGSALRFADQLTIRTKQAAQEPGNAHQAKKKRYDKGGKQKGTVDEGRIGRHCEDPKDQRRGQQQDAGKNRNQELRATGLHVHGSTKSDETVREGGCKLNSESIHQRNCDAYHSMMRVPSNNETIDPMPRNIPNGNSICRTPL